MNFLEENLQVSAEGQDAGREDAQHSIKELFCGSALGQICLVLGKCQARQRGG